jgi:bacterioferritin-associated ferredoxin
LQIELINRRTLPPMIVCSCNVFTDHDVRATLSDSEAPPRTTGDVYGCLGCSAQCGRCARTIRRIMDQALADAAVTGTALVDTAPANTAVTDVALAS